MKMEMNMHMLDRDPDPGLLPVLPKLFGLFVLGPDTMPKNLANRRAVVLSANHAKAHFVDTSEEVIIASVGVRMFVRGHQVHDIFLKHWDPESRFVCDVNVDDLTETDDLIRGEAPRPLDPSPGWKMPDLPEALLFSGFIAIAHLVDANDGWDLWDLYWGHDDGEYWFDPGTREIPWPFGNDDIAHAADFVALGFEVVD